MALPSSKPQIRQLLGRWALKMIFFPLLNHFAEIKMCDQKRKSKVSLSIYADSNALAARPKKEV